MAVTHPGRTVPADGSQGGHRVSSQRSRATNDPRYLPGATGQRAQDRRRRDLVGAFLDACGGLDVCSPLTILAIKRAAELTTAAEEARARVLNGDNNAAALDCLVKLEGEARRATRALGIKVDSAKPRAPVRALGPLRARLQEEQRKAEAEAQRVASTAAAAEPEVA
jgi:hypothetical protein